MAFLSMEFWVWVCSIYDFQIQIILWARVAKILLGIDGDEWTKNTGSYGYG